MTCNLFSWRKKMRSCNKLWSFNFSVCMPFFRSGNLKLSSILKLQFRISVIIFLHYNYAFILFSWIMLILIFFFFINSTVFVVHHLWKQKYSWFFRRYFCSCPTIYHYFLFLFSFLLFYILLVSYFWVPVNSPILYKFYIINTKLFILSIMFIQCKNPPSSTGKNEYQYRDL